jgi:hypothetical protein
MLGGFRLTEWSFISQARGGMDARMLADEEGLAARG